MQTSGSEAFLTWNGPVSDGNSYLLGYRVDYRKQGWIVLFYSFLSLSIRKTIVYAYVCRFALNVLLHEHKFVKKLNFEVV